MDESLSPERESAKPISPLHLRLRRFCKQGVLRRATPCGPGVQSVVHHPPTGREAVNILRKGRFRSACTRRTFERYIVYHARNGASGT